MDNAPLLYLDFDGALGHENVRLGSDGQPVLVAPPRYRMFQHVELLEELLAPYPQVRIVLSTIWVARWGLEFAASKLPDDLRNRIVGTTFREDDRLMFLRLPKGRQVARDVERRRPAAWFAIDDDQVGWPDWALPHVVFSDPYEGISPPEVQDAIRTQLAAVVAKTRSQA